MRENVEARTAGQILLYKPRANLSETDVQRLRDAGFIPLLVQDYDDVKIMDIAGGALPFADIMVTAVNSLMGTTSTAENRNAFLAGIATTLKNVVYKKKASK